MTSAGILRKLALTTHIVASVGWLGAVIAFIPLALSSLTSAESERVRAAFLAMNLIGRFVLAPMAIASLLTGLVVSLSSKWGLVRHYWVVVKFVITAIATIILVKYLQGLGLAAAALEAAPAGAALGPFRHPTHLAHSCAALLALIVNATLSVYKPRGLTAFGKRRHGGSPGVAGAAGDDDGGAAPGTPRWLKVFVIIAVALALVAVIAQVTGVRGRHGPGRHLGLTGH